MTSPGSLEPPVTEVTRAAWIALGVSTLVTFLVVIDISAVNVAFPSIRDDFDISDSGLSWIVSGYNIAVGALLLASGRLADSIGRRKVFLPGVLLFGIGSLLCSLAPTAGFLIAARILQGVGGAVVSAAGFAVMLPGFPPSRRSTAIGIAGAMGALGSVVGPGVGSFLIDAFSWRAIFMINVPLCLLVLVLGPRLLAESKDPNATGRIDLTGVLIGTAAVALVMFAIVQSESWGLADTRVIAIAVVGLALFPTLIKRSANHPEPLINLELFKFDSFRSATIGSGFYGLAFTSGFLTNSLALQDAWDQPIRTVGLALMPAPLIAAFVSVATGRSARPHWSPLATWRRLLAQLAWLSAEHHTARRRPGGVHSVCSAQLDHRRWHWVDRCDLVKRWPVRHSSSQLWRGIGYLQHAASSRIRPGHRGRHHTHRSRFRRRHRNIQGSVDLVGHLLSTRRNSGGSDIPGWLKP